MNIENDKIPAIDAIKDVKGHLYFGEMMRSLRMCDELSQVGMAKKLGISRQYLCNIESGERKSDIELAVKFAEIFNHPKEFFISRVLEDQLYIEGLDYTVSLKAS
jgi:DNA-binding XRE family transcriptional regulator